MLTVSPKTENVFKIGKSHKYIYVFFEGGVYGI